MADSPIFQAAPKNTHVTVADTDTTSKKTLFTAGANGALVDAIAVTSTDTAAAVANFYINDGTTSFQIGQVQVPAGSGTDGTNIALNALSTDFMPFTQVEGGIALGPGSILEVAANVTLTAAKKMDFTVFGGDY